MKQSKQEIEFAIKKQVKEKMPLVLVEKLPNGKVIGVKYAEYLDVSEIKELEAQAKINNKEHNEALQEQQRIEKELQENVYNEFRKHILSVDKKVKVLSAVVLYFIDISLGIIPAPSDFDKLIVWYKDYRLGNADDIYDNETLKEYIGE